MTDQTDNYQRQMQAQYETTAKYRPDESEVRMRREFYPVDAAARFKHQHWPADPFETGMLIDASYLDVADLAAIFKAGKALEVEGNQGFASELVVQKNGVKGSYDWCTSVRVNPLYIDRKRQQVAEICDLLQAFYWGSCESFKVKRQEILEMGDAQLIEMVRQVEESLDLSDRELKIMEVME